MTAVGDDEVFAAFPDVPIDVDNIEHYRGLLSRQLLVNRCSACGTWIYPHRPMCPRCWSWDVTPIPVSGEGSVFMFTVIRQERVSRTQGSEPTVAAAVELAEQVGLRYLSRIVNCPVDELALDMPVRLVWTEDQGRPAPAFEPVTR